MDEHLIKVLGLVSGVYGAVLSTILAVLKYKNETPRLRVRAHVAKDTVQFFGPANGPISDWGVEVEGEYSHEDNENPPFIVGDCD